ncbi:MAG: polysaccharide biosynthesis protein [Trueperaceae bacterium]|nr:polysaccharide biosynthesis protein [Trueperaceae bacterium]
MRKNYLQTLIYFLTIFTSQGLAFILWPITTRYLDQGAFGEYQIGLVVASFVAMMGSAWIRRLAFRLYYEAIERKETRKYFVSVVIFQALAVSLLLLVAFFALVFIFKGLISWSVFLAVVAYVFISDYYTLTINLNRAEEQSIAFAVSEISSGLLRFGLAIGAFQLGFRTPEALLWAISFALVLPAIFSTYNLSKSLTGAFGFSFSSLRDILRHGPASIPAPLATWFEESSDRIVLERLGNKDLVGLYTANYGLADKIIGGLSQAVFMMSWPNILRAYTNNGAVAAKRAIRQAFRMYFWLTTGPMLFIVFYFSLLANLLGESYQQAAYIMPVVVIATWLRDFRTYMNRHIEIQKRFWIMSVVTGIGAVVNLSLNFILIPRMGLMGAAIATLADFSVVTIIYFFLRHPDFFSMPYQDLFACFAFCAVAYSLPRILFEGLYLRAGGFIVIYATGVFIVFFGEKIYSRLEAKFSKKVSE